MNTVFINPYSSGGEGLHKWESVKTFFNKEITQIVINEQNGIGDLIKKSLQNGNINFIAAGGDGTVNFLLNSLISTLDTEELKKIKLGAIGIGSSNDFHKPKSKEFNGIPVKINFEKTRPRDVGCLTYSEKGMIKKKYFLINASLGITAEANYFFNHPDRILLSLKRKNTNLAILYSALRTIYGFKNFKIKIDSDGTDEFEVNLTNLGVIKNPNFSGNLRYNSEINYDTGNFNVHLCHEMSRKEVIHLLYLLNHGKFDKVTKKKSWKTKGLKVSCEDPFYVEYDGEIIKTTCVTFSVLPKLLRVCSC
jgi:diacylglycerol kinase (ATP)